MNKDDLASLMGGATLDIDEILELLPHAYPFVLIDKVESLKLAESIVAIKNVSINEPYFQGHFPGKPIMPGVLILEAMAQATGILALKTIEVQNGGDLNKNKAMHYYASIDKVRFKRVVRPGDQLRVVVKDAKNKLDLWKVNTVAMVGDEVACIAQLSVVRMPAEEKPADLIDSRAEIHPNAKIDESVTIGPWSVIGPDVEIGAGTKIESHVVIKGPTKIGKDNHFFEFSSIGEIPQDKKFHGERTVLEIGANNIFREFVTVHRGTGKGGGITKIGDKNLFMNYSHIAHDCIIANGTVFANNASLAGHVIVEDYAILAGFAAIRQFCRIGKYSFLAKGAIILKDVLPYTLISGHDAKPMGLNSVGLKRNNFSDDTIAGLKRAYKVIYRQDLGADEAIVELEKLTKECPEVQSMIDMLRSSQLGIVR